MTGSWLLVLRFSESLAWLTRLTADQHLRQGQQLGGRQRAQRQIVSCDKMYIRQSDRLDKLYPAFVVVGKTNDDAVLACVWIGMDSFTIDIAYRRKIGHEISINVQTQKHCYWGDQIGQKVDQGKAPLTCKIHAPYFLWLDCLLSVEMPFSVQFRSRVLLEQRGR